MPPPDALARYRPIVDDWAAFSEAVSRPLPACLWTNTLRASPEDVALDLRESGFVPQPLGWLPGAFTLPAGSRLANRLNYLVGCYHIQEEVSMLPVLLLDPQPGERILDLCAAPGNKTAQMAVRMENRGTIVANDLRRERLNVLRTTIDRLGLLNVCTTVYDAATFPEQAGLFDRVLADVPCSCEGTSRKYPEVLRLSSVENSLRLQATQIRILRRALHLCKPGGRVVYATCTYAPEENEMVVAEILKTCTPPPRLLRIEIEGFTTQPGLRASNGHPFPETMAHALRIWPHHNDSGGFFVAVLKKGEA